MAAAVLGLLYYYLQGAVPAFADQYVQRQLQKYFQGQATVKIKAYPFWKLFSGSFDKLTIDGTNWKHQSLSFSTVHLTWADGKIDMGQLEVGLIQVRNTGPVQLTAVLPASFFKSNIPAALQQLHPTISVSQGGITVKAKATYLKVALPVTLTGTLSVNQDHQSISFVPSHFSTEGYRLPLPPAQKVFSLSSVPVPKGLKLEIRSVKTLPGSVRIVLTDP